MIRWVFFDVGNILLDEDPLAYVNFLRHWEAVRRVSPETTFRDLLALREERSAAGSRWPLFEVVARYLNEAQCAEVWKATECEVRTRFAELSPMIAGVPGVLERLGRRYRLGLIANQGRECRERLGDLGLLDRFEVVALSEEVGAFKPDATLFREALKRAGERPAHCLMVGDRLDNDILPASDLGMPTAWVRWPQRAAKGWLPADPDALAFRDSQERSSALAPTLWPRARPTIVIDTIAMLEQALPF